MAKCQKCGKKMGFSGFVGVRCDECLAKDQEELRLHDASQQLLQQESMQKQQKYSAEQRKVEAEQRQSLKNIVLTTETVVDFEIQKRLGVITAECVFGMNIFRDFFAGIRDIVGGRSAATQKVLRDARETVLDELRKEANMLGANAVVGIDLDYSEFSGHDKSMLFIVASGTAVIVDL